VCPDKVKNNKSQEQRKPGNVSVWLTSQSIVIWLTSQSIVILSEAMDLLFPQ
jgi:hypothetical protein